MNTILRRTAKISGAVAGACLLAFLSTPHHPQAFGALMVMLGGIAVLAIIAIIHYANRGWIRWLPVAGHVIRVILITLVALATWYYVYRLIRHSDTRWANYVDGDFAVIVGLFAGALTAFLMWGILYHPHKTAKAAWKLIVILGRGLLTVTGLICEAVGRLFLWLAEYPAVALGLAVTIAAGFWLGRDL